MQRKSFLLNPILFSCFFALGLCACANRPSLEQSNSQRLIEAAASGDIMVVQELVRQGTDVNVNDIEGWTPYMAASTNGRLDVMDYLTRNGAHKTVSID